MYWKECGSKLDEEMKFCANCSAKVKEDEKNNV